MSRPTKAKASASIHAFPVLRAVPAPEYPLDDVAHAKYMEIGNMLVDQGKLNIQTRMLCEQIALLHAGVHKKVASGLSVPQTSFDRIAKLMKELRLVSESNEVSPERETSGEENRYSRIGIVIRPGTSKAAIQSA